MAEASAACSSQSVDVSPLDLQMVEDGERWVIKKYGRVGRPRDKDRNQAQKRVYESNEESGLITLTILTTGHFFISQGHILLTEVRMFRVQFDGDSKEKAQENCDICFQRLQHFLSNQIESVIETSQNFPEQRITMTQVAQGMLVSKQANDTDSTYPCSPLNEQLCSFLKLCLLDQNFPEFVEAVEKELNKLIKS